MVVKLSPETLETLEAFASGRIDMREFAGWLAQTGYNEDLSEDERDERSSYRSRARAPIRLDDVAVERDGSFAELLESRDGAQ